MCSLSSSASLAQESSTASHETCISTLHTSTSAIFCVCWLELWPASSCVCLWTALAAGGCCCWQPLSRVCLHCCCWPSRNVSSSSSVTQRHVLFQKLGGETRLKIKETMACMLYWKGNHNKLSEHVESLWIYPMIFGSFLFYWVSFSIVFFQTCTEGLFWFCL